MTLSWRHDFKNLYGRHHDLVNSYGISVSDDQGCILLVVVTIYLISTFITYHKILMRVTRRVSLVEQELLIRSDRVRFLVVMSLNLYFSVWCFVDHCSFSVDHCIICPSIYGFWLPLWYRQTFLVIKHYVNELVRWDKFVTLLTQKSN